MIKMRLLEGVRRRRELMFKKSYIGAILVLCMSFFSACGADTYTITFDFQGGSGGTQSVKVESNGLLPVAIAPKLEGNMFSGYYTDPNGKGIQYYTALMSRSREIKIRKDMTLYANWIKFDFAGAGTEDRPYLISNKKELITLAKLVNSGHNFGESSAHGNINQVYWALSNNINLEEMEWEPIGMGVNHFHPGVRAQPFINSFYGVFDGRGYEVSNFKITKSLEYWDNFNMRGGSVGLFGANNGTIKNLGIVNFDINNN